MGGGTIALIVLLSFFVLGCVLGAAITLYRRQRHINMGKLMHQIEECPSSSCPLTNCNDASKA
ncbi:hypothetical protein B566_EDAN008837 [Ephemera danica]|nr:hypothetical protein B566_EDAN008837 [Ephemera danica]